MGHALIRDKLFPGNEMTIKNGRRKFSREQKMAILRRHLVDKTPVSYVSDQTGIHPTLFYRRSYNRKSWMTN